MKKSNFRQRGFTLVEMIFVLAIILTLVAIFLPLATSKLSDANTTRVKADEDAMSAGLTAFFSDLSLWPASNGTATSNQALQYLIVGDGGATVTTPNPSILGTGWATSNSASNSLANNIAPTATFQSRVMNLFNHLVINDPNADTASNSTNDYKSTGNKKWKGPYIAKLNSDAYGSNYILNIGAISGKALVNATDQGWIISAGVNGVLDTNSTGTTVSGDDIGYIFCTNCQ